MTRITFSIDGRGPFEGRTRPGIPGEGRIEFIGLPARPADFIGAKTVSAAPENGPAFEAPILRIVTDGGYREEGDDRMTGYVAFAKTESLRKDSDDPFRS